MHGLMIKLFNTHISPEKITKSETQKISLSFTEKIQVNKLIII